MKLLLVLFSDYASVNRERMRTQFLAFFIGSLLIEYAVFKPLSRVLSLELLLWSASAIFVTLLGAIAVVAFFNFLTAYATIWELARDQRLTVPEYSSSAHYKETGKSRLRQDPLKFW